MAILIITSDSSPFPNSILHFINYLLGSNVPSRLYTLFRVDFASASNYCDLSFGF